MTTRYKFNKRNELVDLDGIVVLKIVGTKCSYSFCQTAGKEMANKLNSIEQTKDRIKSREVKC